MKHLKQFRNGLLGMTAAAAVAVGGIVAAPSDADAAAYAYSALEVTNFTATNPFGGFQTFKFTLNKVSADLNGVEQNAGPVQTTSAGGTLNLPQVCVGDCGGFTDNVFFPAPTPFGQGNFAVADAFLASSQILGGNEGSWGTMSGAQVSGDGIGIASSGANHELQWDFNLSSAELAAAGGNALIDFNFNTAHVLELATTQAFETANATLNFKITISGPDNFSTTIFDLNRQISALNSPNTLLVGDGSGTTTAHNVQMTLTQTGNYTLNFLFDTTASVTAVPEPGMLGLLGLGLLGLGAIGLRRRMTTA